MSVNFSGQWQDDGEAHLFRCYEFDSERRDTMLDSKITLPPKHPILIDPKRNDASVSKKYNSLRVQALTPKASLGRSSFI